MSRRRCWRAKRYREYFRVSSSTQLLSADSHSKSFVSRSRLFASLPLPLPASAEKVPSSGIRNFADITVKQMASVHPPLSVSTFLCAYLLFHSSCRSPSRSRSHSQTPFVVFCFMVSLSLSLAALYLSLSFTFSPAASPLILHSALLTPPVLLYLTCLTISQESFGPHEREPPLFSSTTNLQTGTSRIPEDER